MKLIKWTCECGEPLPDYTGYEYVICEKCGTKYRVDNPVVVQPIQYPYITQPVYVPYVPEPSWWQPPYKITCGSSSSSSIDGLKVTYGE